MVSGIPDYEWFQYYDGSTRRREAPSVDYRAAPVARLCINAEWRSLVAGWIWRGIYQDIWPDNKDYAMDMVGRMLADLGAMYQTCSDAAYEGAVMPIGTIFYNVLPTLDTAFYLPMNGSTWNLADYPEFSDIIPSQWENGNGTFTLPDMNGENAALRAASSTNHAIGGNNTVDADGFASHVHTYDEYGTTNLAVSAGGTPIATSVVPRVPRATGGTASQPNTADIRSRRLEEYAHICVANIIETIEGPAGPAGPQGPQGPIGDCSSCPDNTPFTADDVRNNPEDGLLPNALMCGGARSAAERFTEEVLQFLDLLEAIADGSEVLPTLDLFRKVKPGWFKQLDAGVLALVTALRPSFDENYIDDLTCTIYCEVIKHGNFTEDAWDAIKTELGAFGFSTPDPVASFDGFPTAADLTAWLLAYTIDYSSIANEFNEGAVNEDNYCANFCACAACTSVGPLINVGLFDNPDIEVLTPYIDNGTTVTFLAGTWRQIIFRWSNNVPRCVVSTTIEVKRNIAVNVPRYFAGQAGDFLDTDDNGGTSGDNEAELIFDGGREAAVWWVGADTGSVDPDEYKTLSLVLDKALSFVTYK